MPFHIASNAKRLTAARLRALVGFLACVTVAVDAQAARSRKGLVASRTNVAVLRLRKGGLTRRTDVVVMLPHILAVGMGSWNGQGHLRLESRRQRALRIHAHGAVCVGLWRVEGCGRRGTGRAHVRGWRVASAAVRRHGRLRGNRIALH